MKRTKSDPVIKNREFFQSLKDADAPKRALGASIVLHGAMLLFLILFPLLAPQTLKMNYRLSILAPPPPPPQQKIEPLQVKLPPPPKPVFQPIKEEPKLVAETLPVPGPKPAPPAPEVRIIPQPAAPAPPASIKPTILDPKPVPVAPPTQPPVVTNVFSTTISNPAITVPVRNPEASGFGDTSNNREPSRSTRGEGTAVAGFGDVKGVRGSGGTARNVGTLGGFDVGVAGGTPGGSGRGTVLSGGFTSAADAPKPAAPAVKPEPSRNEKPVEITFKPRPDYTDEARKMRIEGEVLLRVLFTSTGEARVLEMIRGLGFGLNENAIRAAEQIRFKPAQRAGQPVDSTAVVHIVFQLAY